MKDSDKYILQKKLSSLGLIIFDFSVYASKFIIGAFIIISLFVFWLNMSGELLASGVDISKPISSMFLMVIMGILIIFINYLINLK